MVLEIITIILLAVILAVVFFYGFRRTGPWGSLWSFILILISGLLVFAVWTEPYGPVYWGIGWFDLLIVGILLALLLAAASPPAAPSQPFSDNEILPEAEDKNPPEQYTISGFFWILILLFLVLIIIGMW